VATQHKFAALALQQNQLATDVVAFVSSAEMRDFSMQATKEALASVGSITTHPYVPGNSFIVQTLEDTLLPKKYTMTIAEKEAKEAMDKTMKALQEIDWQKLEKQLSTSGGNNLDIKQIQIEIKKALKEVDWKKVNMETEAALLEARKELAEEQAALRVQLERYGQNRQQKQEKVNQVQYQILMDRLKENEKSTTCEAEKKNNEQKTVVKKRKIVVI
jgi:nitrogen fixation protein FixH